MLGIPEVRQYCIRPARGEYRFPGISVGRRLQEQLPKQQLDRGIAKNDRVSRRYKRMVRCLKKMQTRLVSESKLDKELPSYLIECIVFNVPDWRFGHEKYLEDFRGVVSAIWLATQDDGDWYDWEEVNGLHYLFRTDDFDRKEVHRVVDKAWDEVGVS